LSTVNCNLSKTQKNTRGYRGGARNDEEVFKWAIKGQEETQLQALQNETRILGFLELVTIAT
jgi:hypothetical protein